MRDRCGPKSGALLPAASWTGWLGHCHWRRPTLGETQRSPRESGRCRAGRAEPAVLGWQGFPAGGRGGPPVHGGLSALGPASAAARAGADEAAVSVAARPGHVSAPAVVEQFGDGVDALHASPFRQRPRRDLGHGVRTIPGVGGQTLGTPPNSAASTRLPRLSVPGQCPPAAEALPAMTRFRPCLSLPPETLTSTLVEVLGCRASVTAWFPRPPHSCFWLKGRCPFHEHGDDGVARAVPHHPGP